MSGDKKRVSIGIVPAVLLKLVDKQVNSFTPDELMVIDAIRRSDNELTTASIEEISDHMSQYSPAQLQGIANNVKGIYHEMRFVDAENSDGDTVHAELYELTNHPGADVRLINTETGEVTDIQLKATNSTSYVGEHGERYPDIDLRVTDEVAEKSAQYASSGFSNSSLSADVDGALDELTDHDPYVEGVAATSGLLSAALNTKVTLQGKQSASKATRKTLEDIGVAGASAAIIEILVG